MIFATTFTLLAAIWATFVTSTVLQSAAVDTTQLFAFDRLIYTAATAEEKVLILCVLSASAALALVTGIFMIRGRRLERRMAAELDSRIATRMQRDAGDSAVSRLLDTRVAELQTSVDTLTAQRDAIYEEIRELRAARANGTISVIKLPDVGAASGTTDEPVVADDAVAEPADRGEQARA
ncbi:MAG TPA: hypothetical protein VE032_09840 [Actinomycetota bacterium]|nr:hypothetical protein [Actinomycetota bacterium]